MQSPGCDWARLQAAGAAGSLQSAREVKVGTSASSPWQEQSLRKMNTLMGEGALFLSLLKKDINSYWKLNAKLNASRATVVVIQACYLQEVCLIIKQTYELYS